MVSNSYLRIRSLSVIAGKDYRFVFQGPFRHHILGRLDLRIVPAPVQERAMVLVIDGVAGNVENMILDFDEFVFELDLVHRTIAGLLFLLFHAAKLRHEDAIIRQ